MEHTTKEKTMNTYNITNSKKIVVKVSEAEFQAALAAYTEINQSEFPGEHDEDESFAAANTYWGVRKSVGVQAAGKQSFMTKVKAFFA